MPTKNRPPDLSRFFGKPKKNRSFQVNFFDTVWIVVSILCGIGAVSMQWVSGFSEGAEFLAVIGLVMASLAIAISCFIEKCDFRLHSIALVLNVGAFLYVYYSKFDLLKVTEALMIFFP